MNKINLQAKVIRNFESQVSGLQTELRSLAHAQCETTELLQQQEADLDRERKYSDELRRKLKVCGSKLSRKRDKAALGVGEGKCEQR